MFISNSEVTLSQFEGDYKRLNDPESPLQPWKDDYYGRLAIVILADTINYSINSKTPEAYEYHSDAKEISLMMKDNKELYN